MPAPPRSRFSLAARAAGVLLHPTALPGPHGVGDLGPAAYRFAEFLYAAGQTWWQMLPLGPPGVGNSPYSAFSAFAGGALLVSLEALADEGLLFGRRPPRGADATATGLSDRQVAYPAVARFKHARLRAAFERFAARGGLREHTFVHFCQAHADWLNDYALYMALRRAQRGRPWPRWPRPLRDRRPAALREARTALREAIDFERFVQFEFDRHWFALKHYANDLGVGLIGDIPIFVAQDSSDVWAHRELFDLHADGRPRTVSGVPPDYFSRTGQLWNHPHYRWERHQASGFAWWLARFRRMGQLFDAVRIDHFLGFHRVWAVPGGAKTARKGQWVKTPGAALFTALRRKLGRLEIIAEDLGVVVPKAVALRERCGFPGLRLLQFAFGDEADSRHNLPHNYPSDCVVYPGTHDNETTAGWFRNLSRSAPGRAARARVLRYLGSTGREIHWDLIRLALASPANTAIIPAQDLLGLSNEARMNTPARARGNWQWRLQPGQITLAIARRLRALSETFERRGFLSK